MSLSSIINQINNLTGYNIPSASGVIISSSQQVGSGSVNNIINYINGITGYSIPNTEVQFVSGANVAGPVIIYTPYSSGDTIPTNGIAPGQIIRAEHILRIIYALSGITEDTIIISGSFLTSGSNVLNGTLSLPFIDDQRFLFVSGGYVVGVDLPPSSSYAISSSYSVSSSFAQSTVSSSYSVSSSFATNALTASYFTGSISNADFAITASHALSGNGSFSGSFSGSLYGTSSWAESASFALTASYALNIPVIDLSGYTTTASFNAFTASYNTGSFTGSFVGTLEGTASWAESASFALSASYAESSSYALSSSYAVSASYSSTASYLNPLNQDVYITGSVFINGTASIDVLNVRYISSSIIYSSGSNVFGDSTQDTQTLVGTVLVSGSQSITGSLIVTQGITGSLLGTSSWAFNAITASYIQLAQSASYVLNAVSSSFASTASYLINAKEFYYTGSAPSGSFITTGSLWIDSDSGYMFAYIDDGSDKVWIQPTVEGEQGPIGLTGPQGPSGSQGPTGSSQPFSFVGNDTWATTSSLQVTGSLTVSGSGTFTNIGPAVFTGSLDVSGSGRFTNGLTVNGPITGNGGGPDFVSYYVADAMAIRGRDVGGTFYIDGDPNLGGTIGYRANTHGFSGQINAGNINAGGIVNISGFNTVLSVSGSNTPSFRIQNPNTIWYFESNRKATAGSLEISNNINPGPVALLISPDQNVSIGTNVTSSFKLDVSGSGRFTNGLTVAGSLSVSGSTTQTGNNTLIGNTTLSGSINVSGSQIFNGSSSFYGTHELSGSNTIRGNTFMFGNIQVSGSSNFNNSEFIITGSTSILGDLNVKGTSVFSNTTFTITGSQYFTGSSFINGNQSLTGNSTVTGSLNVLGNINVVSGSSFTRWGNKLFNYGVFSDTTTQTGAQNTILSMSFNTTDIGGAGVSVVDNTKITVDNTGIYNLQFSAQFDRTTSGTDTVTIWFAYTGSSIPNSATDVLIAGNAANNPVVASWNYVLPMSASSYVEIYWSHNDNEANQVELKAIPTRTGPIRPAVPSVIATLTQIA